MLLKMNMQFLTQLYRSAKVVQEYVYMPVYVQCTKVGAQDPKASHEHVTPEAEVSAATAVARSTYVQRE